MPKLSTSAAVAGSAGVACFLRPEPAQPVAMTKLMMAGMNAYVSYICRIRKPQNETSRDSTAMMMMPTLMLTRPSEMAEIHCPPVIQMMTVKPVMLAKFSSTGNDTIYRLNFQLAPDHLVRRRHGVSVYLTQSYSEPVSSVSCRSWGPGWQGMPGVQLTACRKTGSREMSLSG